MSTRLSRYCAGVMEAGWLLALIISPLFFQNVYSLRVFEPDKIALIRSLALVILAAWLVKVAAEPRSSGGQQPRTVSAVIRQFPLVLPAIALLGVYLIATLLSVSPHTSLFGSYRRMQGTLTTSAYVLLFLAVMASVRKRGQVDRLLTTIIVTSLPVSLYGLIQRCRLDPLEWGGGTFDRISSTLGNPIFLAAYLILSSLLILGRIAGLIAQVRSPSGTPGSGSRMRLGIYLLILTFNLMAIYFTFSRGPLLGLLAGLVVFVMLLHLRLRAGAVALVAVGISLVATTGVIALGSAYCSLRPLSGPTVGRLSQALETEAGTGLVRMLIWRGVVNMTAPHPPLAYSDGALDRWNTIRPAVGYGPETMRIVFPPFYPPELAEAEGRGAAADRAHNGTFDALVTTGYLGVGVQLALYGAIFYYGLTWLRLLPMARDRSMFLGLILGGSALTTLGLVAWRGIELLGVGLSLGMTAGLVALLAVQMARGGGTWQTVEGDHWRMITMIAVFAAIVAHLVEIDFGIAIVSTQTHFWVLVAVLQVLGMSDLRPDVQADPERSVPAMSKTGARARRKQRPASRSRKSTVALGATTRLVVAGLLTMWLITLGYVFINNPTRTTRVGEMLAVSFARMPAGGTLRPSYAILLLILITWALGGAVALLEEAKTRQASLTANDVATSLGLSLVLGSLSWWIVGSYLTSLRQPQAGAQLIPQLVDLANRIAGVLTVYYVMLLMLVVAWAAALSDPVRSRGPRVRPTRFAAGLAGTVGVVGAVILSVTLNLTAVQADMVAKIAFQLDQSGRSQLAVPVLRRAVALAPGESFYALLLGKSILNTITPSSAPSERDGTFAQAEGVLTDAQRQEPLDPDHTANLARMHRQWALMLSAADERTRRREHAQQASAYYERVLRMSPHDARLWNEWAALSFQLLEDPDSAQAKLDRSMSLDRVYDQTYLVQGDLDVWRAQHTADPGRARQYYLDAIQAYREGIRVAQAQGSDSAALRTNLGAAYVATHQVRQAIDEYLRAVELHDPKVSSWQLQFQVARLYTQLGDTALARKFAEMALTAAPDPSKGDIRAFLATLK